MLRKTEISHRTIIFTVLFLGLVWVVIQIIPIIITLFIAVLLATALKPVVDTLRRYRIPTGVSILIAYIILISLVVLSLSSVISPLIGQTTELAERLPDIFNQLGLWLGSLGIAGVNGSLLSAQASQLGALPGNLVHFVIFLFSNLIGVVTVLVVTFYMLVERQNLEKYLLVTFGTDREKQANTFIEKLETRLGGWVRGELVLMLVVGLMSYVGLRLLGIDYALPLAIIAGFLEIVPNIGPIIAAIPAMLVALTISPIMSAAVAALYFLINQLENTLLVPNVMKRATGVNPLVTIIALAVGFKLGSTAGAVLAVPIVITLQTVLTDLVGLSTLRKNI
ncbi:MAG: AI-2E family transporter [Candidatus Blackburnbacteria bacterium]|nr:AI-2E family transporter [Candidatus Blackburnbacteria bacterium]